MKKKLLLMSVALLLAAGAQARIINPGENQVWWGYFNESDFESGDYTIGTGQAMTLMAGIYIPANHPQLGSATIQAVRVYLSEDVVSSLSNMRIWISKELPDQYSNADFYQSTLGTLNAGANDFKLSKPYEVNNEGFYIGYCVKSTTGYFIRCGGADAANSFFVGNPEAGMSWSDLNGNGLGKLAFQILVEGGNFPSNCVTAQDFGQPMVLQGEEPTVPVTFTNLGKDPIETISYTISTEGGSTTDEKELSLNSLPLNGSKTVAVPFDQDLEARKYQKTITITQVNGKPNTASKNTASGFLITLKEKKAVTPVIEEFTGTWCGWCPRGTVGMEKVHAAYDDQVVQIAAHSGDVMAINDYQSVINTYTDGFPNSITDRRYEADPSYSSLQEVLKMSFARLTQASIALSAEWDSEERKGVVFNTTTRFSYSEEDGRYGIAYVLVEDGLKGTGSNWAQANYYSGNGTGDMAWWGNQGSSVSGVEYNHVVVAAWSALNGVDGSVDPVIDADTPQEYSYTASIASKSLIQDKTKLTAIAMLIDRTNGTIVNAAKSAIADYGIETIAFADNNVKAICVKNWDTDGDGELSYEEAAAVTSIGDVFKMNTYIKSFNELQYFTGVTFIGDMAFYGCSSLTSITIPNSVTSIDYIAFKNCTSLTSVTIPESVTSITNGAFMGCTGLASITIPNSVTSIGFRAFSECYNLASITIGNSVTNIGELAFEYCTSLTSIAIPNSVVSIGKGAFYGGHSLISVTIPNSVTIIDKEAFYGCFRLTSITIPASVTSIGDDAFSGCHALSSVIVESTSPAEIGTNSFSNRANAILYVPVGSKAAYEAADYWKEFKKIVEFPNPDVNQDNDVDVLDVVDIARFVVGTPSQSFDEILADINSDGTVNLGDAVCLVNNIAGDQNFVKGWDAPSGIDCNDALSLTRNDGCLSLNLENERHYTAFQLELYVPEGADVTQMLLNAERKQQHQLLYNKVEDGHYRVAALSTSNNEFNGNNGELLNMALVGAEDSEVSIRDIKFFDAQGQEYQFEDIEGAITTSVNRPTPDPSLYGGEIYNLAGQRLNKMQRGVNIVGGKKIMR